MFQLHLPLSGVQNNILKNSIIIEWGWVWCKELCRSRRMLSTGAVDWLLRDDRRTEIESILTYKIHVCM